MNASVNEIMALVKAGVGGRKVAKMGLNTIPKLGSFQMGALASNSATGLTILNAAGAPGTTGTYNYVVDNLQTAGGFLVAQNPELANCEGLADQKVSSGWAMVAVGYRVLVDASALTPAQWYFLRNASLMHKSGYLGNAEEFWKIGEALRSIQDGAVISTGTGTASNVSVPTFIGDFAPFPRSEVRIIDPSKDQLAILAGTVAPGAAVPAAIELFGVVTDQATIGEVAAYFKNATGDCICELPGGRELRTPSGPPPARVSSQRRPGR